MTGSASRRNDAGFTLIELMIVVVIVAVMLTVAAPSFYTTIKNNRLRTEADRIVTSFNLARSESVKRNIDVVVCASSGGPSPSCAATGSAAQGWLIFANVDGNNPPTLNTGTDTVLKVYEALPQGYTITRTDGTPYGDEKIIAFYPDGSSNSPEKIYLLCSQDKDASAAWAISVNPVGGVKASHGDNGGDYQCAP